MWGLEGSNVGVVWMFCSFVKFQWASSRISTSERTAQYRIAHWCFRAVNEWIQGCCDWTKRFIHRVGFVYRLGNIYGPDRTGIFFYIRIWFNMNEFLFLGMDELLISSGLGCLILFVSQLKSAHDQERDL